MFLPAVDSKFQGFWDNTPSQLATNHPHAFIFSVKQSLETFLGLIDPPHTNTTLHSSSSLIQKIKEDLLSQATSP